MGYRRDKVADGTVHNVDAIQRYSTSRCLPSECVLNLTQECDRGQRVLQENQSRAAVGVARGAPALIEGT